MTELRTSNSQLPTPYSLADDEIWALRGISFEVKQGEILGIVGRNGAGKSTLLKILSRVTAPTHGQVRIRGRVASLLEVGTGFHPELTGRENIFLNGTILGMTRNEIRTNLDEIIAFAEVQKFLDTPVKRYSSGMYVRLAFAVAAHLEPEILIVDEVLAVGDSGFQKKCLGKMNSVAQEGRTVIFVSHNLGAIQGLCKRALWLASGELRMSGAPRDVVSDYLLASSPRTDDLNLEQMPRVTGGVDIRLVGLELLNKDQQQTTHFECGDQMIMRFHFRLLNRRHPYFGVEWTICTVTGDKVLYNSSSPQGSLLLVPAVNTGCVECSIPSLPLTSGSYVVNCMLALPHQDRIDQVDGAARFEITRCDVYSTGFNVVNSLGFTTTPATWTILSGAYPFRLDQN